MGGNAKMREFFDRYDLNEESQNMKYSTVAAAYYKRWILAMTQGKEFTEAAPLYEEGRQQHAVEYEKKEYPEGF